jgi:hypothetical protein
VAASIACEAVTLEVLTSPNLYKWVKFLGQDRPRVSGALSRNAT